ncbi:MAG: flippase-like domain-containing protein [Anaerolineales bacterium]|nr:flippase-like domain-containing protein [Anaerolineales bacterium]
MKRWQFWLGILISAFFLWQVIPEFELDRVWETLQEARYWWLLPGVGAYFVGVWARAWRWHYLLRPIKKIQTREMFPIVAIGYMGNNIYPARAGEVLRAYVLRQRYQIPISASLATIFIERAFDGVVMLGFVFFTLPRLVTLTGGSGFVGSIQNLAVIGAAVFLGAVLVFVLMAVFPGRSADLLNWIGERLVPQKFRSSYQVICDRFLDGLSSLRSPKDILMVLLTSIVIWLFETWKYWFVMHAFPFTVSFFALMLMNGIVNLATTIPSAPGYVGTFDATGIAVLEAFGVQSSIAAGYTIVLHAALWLPITLLGAFYMARESISWQNVQQELREDDET